MDRWWGLRVFTPDEGPLLGPGPIQGLWLACGHHRNGVLLAAITAELLTNAISRKTNCAEEQSLLNRFSYKRFTDKENQELAK